MSSGAIVLTAVLMLVSSVIAVVSIEKYKVTVLKDAVTRLTDLISILDGIGLNSDFIDRYDYPDIQTKIRVISRLIERTTEKMKIFIDVNAYIKFMTPIKAHGVYSTYKLNVDSINMTLGALNRGITLYGAKSDKVKTLVRRYDRIMVVSIDGLRSLRNELQVILIKYE